MLPITEEPHSLQQAPSPLSFWWTGLIVVKHRCCCGIDSIWFFNWSLSCTSPSRLTGWMAYFPGANVYLPSDLTICCDLATQVNVIFSSPPPLSSPTSFFQPPAGITMAPSSSLQTSAPWKWWGLWWNWWMCLVLFAFYAVCHPMQYTDPVCPLRPVNRDKKRICKISISCVFSQANYDLPFHSGISLVSKVKAEAQWQWSDLFGWCWKWHRTWNFH